MHQLEASDAAPGIAERLDEGPSTGGGGVHSGIEAGRRGLVGVIGDANGDARVGALAQGRADDGPERGAEAEVIDGDVKGALCATEEVGEAGGDVCRRLLALDEEGGA